MDPNEPVATTRDAVESTVDEIGDALTPQAPGYPGPHVGFPAQRQEGGSNVMNVSSIQAHPPSTSLLDEAATKTGINNFTVNLAVELGPLVRAGQLAEVAPAFVFLAAPREAGYVLGGTGGKPVF